ncbi:rab-GTPase-TBC domain-containing protein [Chytriomyces sp. MP71]|nr:rab-GTPase-TBC domain-containing protein [Chytriomyces sp. MP71]
MASEIRQILEAETLVDIDKLREVGRYGCPEEVRADAWKYLLGVEAPDKSNELSKRQAKYDQYRTTERQSTDVMKRIRGEVARYCRARVKSASRAVDPSSPIENVVSAYLTHFRGTEYSPVMIYLSGPFAYLMVTESDVYYSFCALMQMIEDHYAAVPMSNRLSEFLMLFRTLLPELHNHFEEEEVDFKEVATSWFQYMLAKELPMDCLLRLWDTYFSVPNGLNLHVYICLAILSMLKDNLEELEQSEIHGVLLRLPAMDMDSLINQALAVRDEVLMKRLTEIDAFR